MGNEWELMSTQLAIASLGGPCLDFSAPLSVAFLHWLGNDQVGTNLVILCYGMGGTFVLELCTNYAVQFLLFIIILNTLLFSHSLSS